MINNSMSDINENPLQNLAVGAKSVANRLGIKGGSGGMMSKAMDKLAQGDTLPANLAKQIAPFAQQLEMILSNNALRNKFIMLTQQAEKLNAKQPTDKQVEVPPAQPGAPAANPAQESAIQRMQKLAGIITEDEVEKTVVGHTDDEKDMIMKQLYQTGKYCVELHRMMKDMPDNADFPHWWQAKLVKAFDYIGMTKHYLENELKAPNSDAPAVSPEIDNDQDPSGVS